MILLVGLGNLEEQYAQTRHNFGVMVAYLLAKKLGKDFQTDAKVYQHNAYLTASYNDEKILITLPTTLMNNSGQAVAAMQKMHQLKGEDIWVLHDDVELPFGSIRTKFGGGDGGHNGIKSVDSWIGRDYWRIKLGVGRDASFHDLADYVLTTFSQSEQEELPDIIDQVTDYLLKSISEHKLEKNTFNAKKER